MSETANIYTKVRSEERTFFDRIDKRMSFEAAKEAMANWQASRKDKGKRGGITANTYDVFHAIMRCIAPTMEDVRKHQEGLFAACEEHGEYFAFVSIGGLISMLNSLKEEHSVLKVCKKTIHNQLKKLMEIGIITEKVNHVATGRRNPYPHEANSKGRGKIQLWINPEILHIRPAFPVMRATDSAPFFEDNRKTLPLYRTKSSLLLINKELKSIDNTVQDVDKKALASAKSDSWNMPGEEQGNKSLSIETPKKSALNFSEKLSDSAKKQRLVQQKLWDLLRFNLYAGKVFNEETNRAGRELLGLRLQEAAQAVQAYRKAKIQSYTQNPAYLAAGTRRKREKQLVAFCAKLPQEGAAAFEIVAHAVLKQRKYSEKRNQLDQLYYPTDYLVSSAAQQALNYSIQDWTKIQEFYFKKNSSSKAHFEHLQMISRLHQQTVEQIEQQGLKYAHQQASFAYKKWVQELWRDAGLTVEKREALLLEFECRFKPLFLRME